MDKITENWNKSGLLDGLENEVDKILLAHNLNDAVNELIKPSNDIDKIRETKASMFLPIVVRLFCEKNLRVIDDMAGLFKKFEEFFKENIHLYDLNSYICQDREEQLCELFVTQYEV